MAISNTLVTTSNSVMYASSGANAVSTMIVCNYGASSSNLTLYAVPSAEVSGTTTQAKHTIISALPIPAGETVSLDQEKLVFANGDTLIAIASVGSMLSFTISTLAV
jgi:serine phosphatase RsbU (regulator of sigma subunit)